MRKPQPEVPPWQPGAGEHGGLGTAPLGCSRPAALHAAEVQGLTCGALKDSLQSIPFPALEKLRRGSDGPGCAFLQLLPR